MLKGKPSIKQAQLMNKTMSNKNLYKKNEW